MAKTYKLIVAFSDQERKDLDMCLEALGKTASEFVRSLITDRRQELFPYYKVRPSSLVVADSEGGEAKSKKEELTKEQICERMGGRIVKRNGVSVCEIESLNRITGKKYVSNEIPLDLVSKKMLDE